MEFGAKKREPSGFHPALSYPLSPGVIQRYLEEKGVMVGSGRTESGTIGSGRGELLRTKTKV